MGHFRYDIDKIYTYVGDILIAVNPFRLLPIYDADSQKIYRGTTRTAEPPHVYAMADAASDSPFCTLVFLFFRSLFCSLFCSCTLADRATVLGGRRCDLPSSPRWLEAFVRAKTDHLEGGF